MSALSLTSRSLTAVRLRSLCLTLSLSGLSLCTLAASSKAAAHPYACDRAFLFSRVSSAAAERAKVLPAVHSFWRCAAKPHHCLPFHIPVGIVIVIRERSVQPVTNKLDLIRRDRALAA